MDEKSRELLDKLRYHRDLYYNDHQPDHENPPISDAAYDAIEQELKELAINDKEIALELESVGRAPTTGFAKVKHDPPMLSLDKIYDKEELTAWVGKQKDRDLLLWPKFDGVSLSLHYENGSLTRAATRGDGETGEDITVNVAMVKNLPKQLNEPFTGEVRGEVVMHKDDFEEYNTKAKAAGQRVFANPRNAVSGSLRLKVPVSDRPMCFYPFDLVGYFDGVVDGLNNLGFDVIGSGQARSANEVKSYIDQTEGGRDSLNYEIDGIVIRLADPAAYKEAGFTGHHPRGAIAYKLAAEIVETKLLEVDWQVGKTGLVTPRGRLEPAWVAGAMVEYASLHNLSVIKERDIRLGDNVRLRRSGEVIPQVLGPVEAKARSGKEEEIIAPSDCPSCGQPLQEEGPSRLLRCHNTACAQQLQRRLEHWVSRPAADIDALGEKLLAKLIDNEVIESIADLYRLDEETLMPEGEPLFAGLGTKSVERLLDSIETSKDLGLRRALIGLSIPLASEGTAKRLCRGGYQTIEDVASAGEEELARIEDIGPLVASSLNETLNRHDIAQEIKQLHNLGVDLSVKEEDGPSQKSGNLVGKRVVLTGTLSVSRPEFAALLEAAGAEVSGSVSKKTDFVVCGDNAGSKQSKAEKLGLEIINEVEARALLTE